MQARASAERHLQAVVVGVVQARNTLSALLACLPDTDGAGERRKQTVTRDWNKWASYVVIVAFVFHPCFLSREISAVPDPRRGAAAAAAAATDGITAASRLVEFADRITDQPRSVSDVTSSEAVRVSPSSYWHVSRSVILFL